jgi:drug/metabolite transporter (DMT)-like permease
LEFLGAQGSVISFNAAITANLNGGICGAIIALNTVFVFIAAYFMFNEAINKVKFLSMCLLIASVILVSFFRPEAALTANDMYDMMAEAGVPTGETIIKIDNNYDKLEETLKYHQMVIIIGGLVASACFGSQLLVFKHIMK